MHPHAYGSSIALKNHPAGAFVVSHDRELLQHVEHIYALNEFGLSHVTGNYEELRSTK